MNTRLQVEHPVTELVTGRDLVREQFHGRDRRALVIHAGRYRAGRATRSSAASTRKIRRTISFRAPEQSPYFANLPGREYQIDSGVTRLSEVSIHYDPMIAKLAVWGRTREEAIDRLKRALDEYEVSGITTTLPFFREVVDRRRVHNRAVSILVSSLASMQRQSPSCRIRSQLRKKDDMAMIAAALEYLKVQRRSIFNAIATLRVAGKCLDAMLP